jgi:gp16 family phage-associated protein
MLTRDQVKQHFAVHGLSIRDWAASRGFSESLVYAVLAGKNKASRGESFRIAVALGLREEPKVTCAPTFVLETMRYLSTCAKTNLTGAPPMS